MNGTKSSHTVSGQIPVAQRWLDRQINDYIIYGWGRGMSYGNAALYGGDTLVSVWYDGKVYVKRTEGDDPNHGPARGLAGRLNMLAVRQGKVPIQSFPFPLETLFTPWDKDTVKLVQHWQQPLTYQLQRKLCFYNKLCKTEKFHEIYYPRSIIQDMQNTKATVESLSYDWHKFLRDTQMDGVMNLFLKELEAGHTSTSIRCGVSTAFQQALNFLRS